MNLGLSRSGEPDRKSRSARGTYRNWARQSVAVLRSQAEYS
jgi:hypothetical protein